MHGRPQERPELCAEELRLVEADPNRAPPEERILLLRHVQEHRELVAAQVEGPDVHRRVRERLRGRTIRLVLLLLTRHRAASDDEELGAEQADADGTMRCRAFGFVRKVEVRTEFDVLPVLRHRFERRNHPDLVFPARNPVSPRVERGTLTDLGVENETPDSPVDDRGLAFGHDLRRAPQSYDRGDTQRASQHRPVGGAGPVVRRDPEYPLHVELHGHARSHVRGDEDDRFVERREIGRVVLAEKAVQDPDHEILQVVEPVEHHRVRGPAPHRPKLEHAQFEAALRRESVLADVADRPVDDLRILQHQQLGVEDPGLDRTEPSFRQLLRLVKALGGPRQRLPEALDLSGCVGIGDRPVRDDRNAPLQPEDPSRCHSLGRRVSVQNHRHGSLTPPLRRNRARRAQ